MRFLNKEILSSFDCTLLYGLRGKTKKVVFLKKWLDFFCPGGLALNKG